MMNFKDTISEHKHDQNSINYGIITVSDTRTFETDDAGALLQKLIIDHGHHTTHRLIVKDDFQQIQSVVVDLIGKDDVDAIITTGGTGVGKRDVTIEAVTNLFEKVLPAFFTLFATLSHAQIGSAAMLSRATAGIVHGKVLFCIPGSPKACKLAMEQLILRETNHILNHTRGGA